MDVADETDVALEMEELCENVLDTLVALAVLAVLAVERPLINSGAGVLIGSGFFGLIREQQSDDANQTKWHKLPCYRRRTSDWFQDAIHILDVLV